MDNLENTEVEVRRLLPADLKSVIDVDAALLGKARPDYYTMKLQQALAESGIQVSLAAEIDGLLVGFLLARVYYGEFGSTEEVAVLDSLGVHPEFANRGVGQGMFEQLQKNLQVLGIKQIRTEVSWDNQEMLSFFQKHNFVPGKQLCLELDLSKR